jgi:CheY-like chemotaxis protein
MHMPGMDGLTLSQRLRELQPHMVTMIITGDRSPDLVDGARSAGVRHIVLKPISFPRLLALVKEALGPRDW